MTKKVRFPLEMDYGIEVRDLEALRENFSLSRVIEYFKNGKLITWLQDRYANDLAEALKRIDVNDSQVASKICEVFGVEFDETVQEELEKAMERADRIEQLKKYTDDAEYIKNVDNVAFNQDELYDLLDEERTTIYLCGERFAIPLAKSGITYIGINSPIAVIDSKVEVDWLVKGITLKAVIFDEKYEKVVESAEETKKILYDKVVESVKSQNAETKESVINSYSNYRASSILNFMLSPADKAASAACFDKIADLYGTVRYDLDDDIRELRQKLVDKNIIGIAKNYLGRL